MSAQQTSFNDGDRVWISLTGGFATYVDEDAERYPTGFNASLAAKIKELRAQGIDRVAATVIEVDIPLDKHGYGHYQLTSRQLNGTRRDSIGADHADLEPIR